MKKDTKLLIILDGWGHSSAKQYNAIAQAKTPNLDKIFAKHPHTLIHTSGSNVGLPNKQMGNSEVGHINLGAGRVVKQEFTRITDDIANGDFYRNHIFKNAIYYANNNKKAIHVMGLLSDGGVHSHQEHIFAMLDMLARQKCSKVFIHIFTDGRDCPPKSAKQYITKLEAVINKLGIGKIVSVIGRYHSMDRDNRWGRIRHAYELIRYGMAKFSAKDATEAVDMAYARGESDEFISSTKIGTGTLINKGDVLIFMNYRADRARQITQPFTDENFQGFSIGNYLPIQYFCLTEYKKEFNLPVAYPNRKINNVLGKYLSNLGYTQLRIAETEKYAHVTFFLNGGVEKPFNGEDRILIPSPDVLTYDKKPEMSAFKLTERLVDSINSKKYNLIICNYANADMVGHSGKLAPTIKAVEAVDTCLGKVYDAIMYNNAEMIITADHGNAELMYNTKTNTPHTAHTNNSVPLFFIGRNAKIAPDNTASLSDIAPTLITLMGLEVPKEMTGKPLIKLQ